MDHHCPWTANCVSYRTFPHFLRFLLYAVVSMIYLEYLLYIRLQVLWGKRNLPSVRSRGSFFQSCSPCSVAALQYLGPTATQLVFLAILPMVNSITLFALAILLVRNIWAAASNVTTIEGWEIERHEALLHKARKEGGYLDGPDGKRIKIIRQEFPFDIGLLQNLKQSLGKNPLTWLLPFAATLPNDGGLEFITNGFEGMTPRITRTQYLCS